MITPIDMFHSIISGYNGLVPRNRFSMMISPNATGSFPGLTYDETLLCEQISIPGKRIETLATKTFGISQNFPSGYELPEVTLTFVLVNAGFLKRKFESWANSIVDDSIGEYYVAYKSDIVVDITLTQLDQMDMPLYSVRLLDAFPNQMGSVDSTSGSDNDYQRFNVSFVYDKLISI